MSFIRRRGLLPAIDWQRVPMGWLPFADAASADLPLSRLLRLSLFQVSVGLATALMVGTLNRVMIVELGVGAWLVAAMVALPLLVAPLRALIGWKSDTHRSALGWRRVPFVWFGTLMQFGGLAIMPFSLVLLTGETAVQLVAGHVAAALAFLLVGAGLQTTQTAGLALATDLGQPQTRGRIVALMYLMLLVGMVGAGLLFGALLADYSHTRLVQVVQGSAVASVLLNAVALWKQEARDPARARKRRAGEPVETFSVHWQRFAAQPKVRRFLVAVGLGTAAFGMQDIILEPYGGEILRLGVAATTQLTALMAGGAIVAFAIAARTLGRGADPMRVAAAGAIAGLFGFSAVIFAEPADAPLLFRAGAVLIGLGGGLFSVGTLSAAMALDGRGDGGGDRSAEPLHGLVLGAWGAVQATSLGLAIAAGGLLRDLFSALASAGWLGSALQRPATGYGIVYHLELLLLFVTLAVIGPLVRRHRRDGGPTATADPRARPFGLADFPG